MTDGSETPTHEPAVYLVYIAYILIGTTVLVIPETRTIAISILIIASLIWIPRLIGWAADIAVLSYAVDTEREIQ